MIVSATIILTLGLGHRTAAPQPGRQVSTEALLDQDADAIIEPV